MSSREAPRSSFGVHCRAVLPFVRTCTPVASLVLACTLASCEATRDLSGEDAGSPSNVDASTQPARCHAPAGVSNAPESVAQLVTLLNALPKPLTLPCFLESLARPLSLHAVHSVFSAQPAVGRRSPRIFLFSGPLVMSIVPAGVGAHLLELGEQRGPVSSLKAELEFPITEPLDAAAPYRRLPFNDAITTCGACHQGEFLAPDVGQPLAFVSQALKPLDNQRVPLSSLMTELVSCDASAEPERCALLDALLGPTPAPREWEFPETYNSFF